MQNSETYGTLNDEQESDDDTSLMTLIAADNDHAFQTLVQKYKDRIKNIAYGVLKSEAEAEDAAQEVLWSIWVKRKEWSQTSAKFTTWLYRVTVNKAIDIKRTNRFVTDIDTDDYVPDKRASSEALFLGIQEEGALYNIISRLPENYRDVMVAFYFDEIPMDDLCKRFGATESSLRSQLKRGRAMLKEYLKEPAALRGL